MLDVTMIGCGGTMPLPSRALASCHLRLKGRSLLIDAGEGTQTAMRRCGLTFKPIDIIFITHFHADHISGLPGLLLSMGNEGREEPVTIIGPKGLRQVCDSLRVIAPELLFDLNYIELDSREEKFDISGYRLTAFRVEHSTQCYSLRVDIDRAGKFDPKKARQNGIPVELWHELQAGNTVAANGSLYEPKLVMGDARPGIRFVYCTDTRPLDLIADEAKNAELLICEGMYASPDKLERAKATRHMLFSEAAGIAKRADVKRLWLTHYSPSLPDPEKHMIEATGIFAQAEPGFDGKAETLAYPEL